MSTLKNSRRSISYIEAIKEALEQSLEADSRVIVIGEGVPDPKSIFGSTSKLQEKFGSNRVFDMPLSENGVTGICIGAAIRGMRPILVHQRVDFALLSLDQIFNNAAKWHYMFNGGRPVPMVIRMVIGRGWGQGPQHSQSLQAIFAAVPGLKVVMPTFAPDAKGMLIASIRDDNPVIFIEHRWLHGIKDYVSHEYYETTLDQAKIVISGDDITVATFSYMTIEALIASKALKEILGIRVELIDMRCIRPLDSATVIKSVKKTRRLIVADTAHSFGSIAAELISQVVERSFDSLLVAPARICSPDFPVPASFGMTKNYYPSPNSIIKEIIKQMGIEVSNEDLDKLMRTVEKNGAHDVPHSEFNGPF